MVTKLNRKLGQFFTLFFLTATSGNFVAAETYSEYRERMERSRYGSNDSSAAMEEARQARRELQEYREQEARRRQQEQQDRDADEFRRRVQRDMDNSWKR